MRCAKVLGAKWAPIMVIVDALIFMDLVNSKHTVFKVKYKVCIS